MQQPDLPTGPQLIADILPDTLRRMADEIEAAARWRGGEAAAESPKRERSDCAARPCRAEADRVSLRKSERRTAEPPSATRVSELLAPANGERTVIELNSSHVTRPTAIGGQLMPAGADGKRDADARDTIARGAA